jgi:hypothetical protein
LYKESLTPNLCLCGHSSDYHITQSITINQKETFTQVTDSKLESKAKAVESKRKIQDDDHRMDFEPVVASLPMQSWVVDDVRFVSSNDGVFSKRPVKKEKVTRKLPEKAKNTQIKHIRTSEVYEEYSFENSNSVTKNKKNLRRSDSEETIMPTEDESIIIRNLPELIIYSDQL